MIKPPAYLVSLGCAKNLVDSEVMLGSLLNAGYSIASSPSEAETIIINTCSFIKEAEEEAFATIAELAHYKEAGACNLLVVTGCLPQRYGRSLSQKIPEADVFIGTNDFFRIVEILEHQDNKFSAPRFYLGKTLYLYDDGTPRVNTASPGHAYVKIAEGCSHGCSFCIIPKIRGPFRSRSPDSLVREVSNLATQGIKETNLIAQDTTLYGKDLSPPAHLPMLLQRLAQVEGIEWIRLLYANPHNVSETLIEVIQEEEALCPYLDIPLQHSNPEILKAMNRKGDPHIFAALVNRLRERIPGITIRTTLMVGFPGETDAQFQDLLDFVRQVEFDRLGVFAYSNEKGTAAERLPHQIPSRIKEERRNIIMAAQAEISREKNRKLVGTRQRLLLEQEDGSEGSGRIASQAPEVDGITRVIFDGDVELGRIYDVLITEAEVYDLSGIISNH
jgi:ribosomal protein S12 methylthiotransferase